jgi:hypothetical protein
LPAEAANYFPKKRRILKMDARHEDMKSDPHALNAERMAKTRRRVTKSQLPQLSPLFEDSVTWRAPKTSER